jgi:hypothetical protein
VGALPFALIAPQPRDALQAQGNGPNAPRQSGAAAA